MPDDIAQLTEQVTRGFAGLRDGQHERDAKLALLSDKMIGVELKLDQLKESVGKVEKDVSSSETERLKMRVEVLEKAAQEAKEKQKENARWIKGLVASVIVLLLGVLRNYIRIG